MRSGCEEQDIKDLIDKIFFTKVHLASKESTIWRSTDVTRKGQRLRSIKLKDKRKKADEEKERHTKNQKCNICEKVGHVEEDCYSKNPKCNFCEKVGHVEEDCYTKNRCVRCNGRHTTNECTKEYCEEYSRAGHTKDECWNLIECKFCGKTGHLEEKCYNRPCEHCGKVGHRSDICWKTKECNLSLIHI